MSNRGEVATGRVLLPTCPAINPTPSTTAQTEGSVSAAMGQTLQPRIPLGTTAAVSHRMSEGDCLDREVVSPTWPVTGTLQSQTLRRGESVALSTDEVNTQELDVTLHGCRGGPVTGTPRESLVCSPRVSSLGTSGNPPEVTSVRSVAEGRRPGDREKSGTAEEKSSGDKEDEQESENPSETGADTGAVDDLSSGGEGKEWATPRNLDEDTLACPLTIAEDCSQGDLPLNAIS